MSDSTSLLSDTTRDLQCPRCGYVVVNYRGIGAVYCGPHVNGRGEHSPAVQMRTIRDWPEFARENNLMPAGEGGPL